MNKILYNIRDYGILPDGEKLQTEAFQAVLDLAGKTGGTVLIPKGTYVIGGLLLHSNTVLSLESGACLLGSENPSDYQVFPIPEGVVLHTDMEMVSEYFAERKNVRKEYRRALISAYGAENIAILGSGPDSVIDGRDCYDPDGEEHLRGPHGIFFSNCKNVTLRDYTIRHCGNFHHQIDTCEEITVSGVQVLGGHDGFHLHFCKNADIGSCVIHSGDDCIAGIMMENITVHDCDLNTSCQLFRIGGQHIRVKNCHMWGPGEYPYRASALIDGKRLKPKEEWHTDICSMMEYFASLRFRQDFSYDIVFENCEMENTGKLLYYVYGAATEKGCHYCGDTPLTELTFRNCRMTGRCGPSVVKAPEKAPLKVIFEACTGVKNLFDESAEHLIIEEK